MYVPVPSSLNAPPLGTDGAISNVAQAAANAGGVYTGNGSMQQNPVGQTGVLGSASNMDWQGAGVVGAQDQCASLNSGIGSSGQDANGSCMASSELNCDTGNSSLGGTPNSLGQPCDVCGGDNGGQVWGNDPAFQLPPTSYGNPYNPYNPLSPLYSGGPGPAPPPVYLSGGPDDSSASA